MKRRLSEIHPIIYKTRIWQKGEHRENEMWRETVDRRTGNHLAEEMLVKNFAEVKYELSFTAGECSL